jgi:[ribosomal protein S5]-alanine N-acetyltransferase
MENFPVLETKRLILRQPQEADIDFIFLQRSSPIVNKYIKREPAKTREDAVAHFEKITRNFHEDKGVPWSICLKENNQLIGFISLWNYSEDRKKAEVGYDLHPDFHNRGFMSEAIVPVLHHCFFAKGFEILEGFTDRRNEASKRILLKSNFTYAAARTDEDNADNWVFVLKKGEPLPSL